MNYSNNPSMSNPILEEKGRIRKIWWADKRAKESFEDALCHCSKEKQRKSVKARFAVLLKKIANQPLYSREGIQRPSFPEEGELPANPGSKAKKYYALKKQPIRAYGWFFESNEHSNIGKGDFVISHCVHKDHKKKKKIEDDRIANKWRVLEAVR